MSSSLVASTRFLPDASVRSHAPAVSEVVQALAGKARVLSELARGAPVRDGEGLATPLNPQGLIGVDFSGPPWGSAFRHPIAIHTRGPSTFGCIQPARLSLTEGYVEVYRWAFVNRPHAALPSPSIAPYSRGMLRIAAMRTAGTGTVTLRVTTWNHSLGQTSEDAITTAVAFSSSASVQTDVGLVPLRPGANEISIMVSHTDALKALEITSMLLFVDAKRSH